MERLTIDEVIEHCNRNVKMKEKYAGREFFEVTDVDSNFVKEYWEHRQVAEWLKQLKAYKDAEEQGLLLRLLCKVGDTVYEIHHSTKRIIPRRIKSIVICNALNLTIMYKSGYDYSILHEDFGKTVFLTREEAEKALEDMKGK